MFSDISALVPIRVPAHDYGTLIQIQDLRRLAWEAGGEVPDFIAQQDILKDEHDVHGMHWAVQFKGKVIASARLCIHENVESSPDPEALDGYEQLIEGPIGILTRLVVDKPYQGQGLSTVLDKVRLRVAEDRDCKSVVGIAELEFRMRSLERLGFVRLGPTRLRYLTSAPSFVLVLKCT